LEREGKFFRLRLSGEEALKPLIESIDSADIRKVCPREPSLEDVFIALTGREVRE
jgi:ABC-2 type transport system ATP-binding protein